MQGQRAPQQQQAGAERIPASLRRRRAAAAAAAAVAEAAERDSGSEADSEVIHEPSQRHRQWYWLISIGLDGLRVKMLWGRNLGHGTNSDVP